MKYFLLIVFFALLLSGCGIHVVPRATSQVNIGPDKESVTLTQNGLTVTAKVQDLDFGPYTGVNNITSFYVTVTNNSTSDLTIPLSAFLLFDQDRKLYRPLEAERVTALNKQEASYLIPYPFVGFYYLQDRENFDFSTQSSSTLNYSAQLNSAPTAEAYALPLGLIPSGANISGMLFFNVDLYEKKSVELSLNLKGDNTLPEENFAFVFDIVK